MTHSRIIAVDWGTSHLRAYLCELNNDDRLTLLDIKCAAGVAMIKVNFEDELFNCISPWLDTYGQIPIIMSGQIGSNIGWRETGYLHSPVNPSSIASQCLNFNSRGHQITIIPGVSCQHANGTFDVMRGEELQVLGWLQTSDKFKVGEHIICLPGTHTKWVKVVDGKINMFKTSLTGELYYLLSQHSVLIQQQTEDADFESFKQGVLFAYNNSSASLVHILFSVRSKQIANELNAVQAHSYMSGLLIGSDVSSAINSTEWDLKNGSDIYIIGSNQLAQNFSEALNLAQIPTTLINSQQATLNGFAEVYRLHNQA